MNTSKDRHIKIIVERGIPVSLQFRKRAKFKPIPFILSFGFLFHKIHKGDRAELFCSYYAIANKMKLIYFQSSGQTTLDSLNCALDEFYDLGKQYHAGYFETLIVNKSLSPAILEREGWKFSRKSWFIGNYYIKTNDEKISRKIT